MKSLSRGEEVHDLVDGDGLEDHVAETELHALFAGVDIGRDGDDVERAELRIGAKRLQHLAAVHLGHPHVGGYKAMYVPYTISKIIATLPEGKEIDWKRIWRTQDIYPSFAHQLEIVAMQTMDFLQEVSKKGNERTYAIKEETWKKYLAQPLTLTDDFIADAVDSSFEKEEAKTQERQTRFNMATDVWAHFMGLGVDYLNRVYKDMERLHLLSGAERESVRICAISVGKMTLSDRQAKRLAQIFQRLDQETDYIIPEK